MSDQTTPEWAGEDVEILVVDDDGVGLEEQDLERVFELFHRGDGSASGSSGAGGLGLGLPVARRLVELHGGTLRAASDGPGQGATFSFRRSLSPDADRAARAGAAEASTGDDGDALPRRVLVVEDNRDAADVLARLLMDMGHEVSVAHDARSALADARERPPEVVLSDINLPGDMDGYGLAGALREVSGMEDARLVAVTGYGRDVDRARAREAGFDDHLTKPVGLDMLTRVLRD